MISIEINDEHDRATGLRDQIERAVSSVLSDANIANAEISIAVVDDRTIWKLNREFLEHDYPTDVLSFVLSHDDGRLEGEIVVSADTAAREAEQHDWPADNELLLYVVHGALHLVGYDDSTQDQRQEMRGREKQILLRFEIVVPNCPAKTLSAASGGTQS